MPKAWWSIRPWWLVPVVLGMLTFVVLLVVPVIFRSTNTFDYWLTSAQIVGGGVFAGIGVWLAVSHANRHSISATLATIEMERLRVQREELDRERLILEDWYRVASECNRRLRRFLVVTTAGQVEPYAERIADISALIREHWFDRLPVEGTREYTCIKPILDLVADWHDKTMNAANRPGQFGDPNSFQTPASNQLVHLRRVLKGEIEGLLVNKLLAIPEPPAIG